MSFSITDEHVHDAKAGKELLKSVKDRIRRIFADRGYDSKAIYNSFGENTISNELSHGFPPILVA